MNKKGFTLIELLAVIAILAILVIIAVPKIIKIFNDAKRGTFVAETQNIYKRAQTDIVSEAMNNNVPDTYDSNDNPLNIKTNNKYIVGVNNKKVSSICVSNGEFMINLPIISSIDDIDINDIEEGECGVSRNVRFVSIYARDYGVLAIDSKGQTWSNFAPPGNGDQSLNYPYTPIKITNTDGNKFESFSNGWASVTALDSEGQIWEWGDYDYNYSTSTYERSVYIPTKVTNSDGTRFIAISSGNDHTIAIDENEQLWVWGEDGTTVNKPTPTKVTNSDGTAFTKIYAGVQYSMAIDEIGQLWAWGLNTKGRFGNGSVESSDIPLKIINSSGMEFDDIISNRFLQVFAKDVHGDVWCWGDNSDGQLGIDSTMNYVSSPVRFTFPEGVTFKSIRSEIFYSTAIDTLGNFWIWGQNKKSGGANMLSPVKMTSPEGIKFTTSEGYYLLDESGYIWQFNRNNQTFTKIEVIEE